MENGNKSNDKKPAVRKSGYSGLLGTNWFLKLFLIAAVAAFILAFAVACGGGNVRHKGQAAYGFRNDGRCNMMYFNKGQAGERVAITGGCPMLEGSVQSQSGTISTFSAPVSGPIVGSKATLGDPYLFSDLAEVFMIQGKVTTVTTGKITLADSNKVVKTVNISADTIVKIGEIKGELSNVKVGDTISVVNLPDADGAMSAQLIRILAR